MVNKMKVVEVLKKLDKMNEKCFKYIGIYHTRAGNKDEVETTKEYLDSLNAEIIEEIKIDFERGKNNFERLCLVIDVNAVHINIYRVDDLKDKLFGVKLTKHQPILILKYG
jgi:hypothetical protein